MFAFARVGGGESLSVGAHLGGVARRSGNGRVLADFLETRFPVVAHHPVEAFAFALVAVLQLATIATFAC